MEGFRSLVLDTQLSREIPRRMEREISRLHVVDLLKATSDDYLACVGIVIQYL